VPPATATNDPGGVADTDEAVSAWSSYQVGRRWRCFPGVTTEGKHMTTTDHDDYHEHLEKWRAFLTGERTRADRLISEDGSPEARAEAKSIRIRATLAEKRSEEIDNFVHGRGRGRWAPGGDLYTAEEAS
jgi:transposase